MGIKPKITANAFTEKVWMATKRIPKGRVATYQTIAFAIGIPKSVRAVGNALNKNRQTEVPCHRVIRSDGRVGGFARGARSKIEKLKNEGIQIKNGAVDLKKYAIGKINS